MRETGDVEKRRLTRTYDEFFASTSKVSRVQFWGLLVLGGTLIAGTVAVLTMLMIVMRPVSLAKLAVGLLGVVIYGFIMWLGIAYIRRAFR